MEQLDLKNYLYHGIIDWLNYDKEYINEELCIEKLESILEARYIYKPIEFKEHNITHNDTSNPYTVYYTFLSCHPKSIYSKIFTKNIEEDKGYLVSTTYANLGILFNPILLEELTISETRFCDQEIVLEDNISLDKYGVGLYINMDNVSKTTLKKIKYLIEKHNYDFKIINIKDGTIIKPKEENKTYKLII